MDNELRRFIWFSAAVACRVAPTPRRFATPAYAPAALLALLLLRERLRPAYHGPEDLLRLSSHPRCVEERIADHTVSRFAEFLP